MQRTVLRVKVTPHANRNSITGFMDDGTVMIRLTASPVKGKANRELIEFLSEILNLSPSCLKILSGKTGRLKLIIVQGLDEVSLRERLDSRIKLD